MPLFKKKKKSTELIKVWEFAQEDDLSSSPVVANLDDNSQERVIVFGTKGGKLYVVDDEAKIKWLYDLKEKLTSLQSLFVDTESSYSIYTTPVVYDINKDGKKEIIFGSDNGIIFVLDHSGNLIWNFKTKGNLRGELLVKDINDDDFPEIVFGSSNGYLYCLDYTGSLLWRFDSESPIESAPELLEDLDDDYILFGNNNGKLICINKQGILKWQYKTEGKIVARPVISHLTNTKEKFILVGSEDNNLYCLTSKGDLKWYFETEGRIVSSVSVSDINKDKYPEIIFGSCDNRVYALNYKGKELWNYETDFWITTAPIIMDIDDDSYPEIIVGSFDHSVYILDSKGSFVVNYVPGLMSVTPQIGDSGTVQSSSENKGRLLFKQKMDGVIIGTHYFIDEKKNRFIILGIKTGKLDNLKVKNG